MKKTKEYIKAKLNNDEKMVKILELEEKLGDTNTQLSEEKANVAQYETKVFDKLETLQKIAITKSPACRMDEESIEQCVSRKIPELMDEGYDQDQASAIAYQVCSVRCNEEKQAFPESFELKNAELIIDEIKKATEGVSVAHKQDLDNIGKSYKEIAEWLKKIATKETKVVVEKQKDNIVVNLPTSARNPIAVRLSDGDRFYNSIVSGLSASNDGVIAAVNNILDPLSIDPNGYLNVNASLGDLTIDTIPYSIAYGPLEDTGYLYIAYQDANGYWYMKRQNLVTYAWQYVKGTSNIATNWTNRASLLWTDYDTQNGIATATGVLSNSVIIDQDLVGLSKESTLSEISTKLDTLLAKTIKTIDTVHDHIHDGYSFSSFDVIALAGGQTYTMIVNTNDTFKKHSFLQAYLSEELEVITYELVTTTSDGTSVPIINRNRNSSISSNATIFHTPTGLNTAGSTIIRHARVGSKNTFGDTQQTNEMVLKSNTKYAVTFTNRGNNTAYLNWQWFWYECGDCE